MKECKSKLGHEKAEWAVDRARCELQRVGYVVYPGDHVCKNGADLKAHGTNGRIWTIEVKLVLWNKEAWRVNRVTRKMDDVIAMVFPSGVVHFEMMRDHLKACNKSGDRYLTALGRFFE